ncbi:MAG: 4-hydroxy-tetrahydrodipicolinate reductase [Trueperaceae bacterium]|nr:4-hydroxy-tetrahydrodipicolinate reductase [Trueperaceae bacterium]MCC6311222.1 4-hydroxy-tetrahydrodipicolinate reductase [Trueperaceae bacterium]MCO5174819.1 4-hydroxy-tetrahydrodipicolinate reductase [Trueperaceae bacterium]MCW5818629.1 4-hydroxy-tetrahydrodipicolinate reductase [Trueperaceae bacterium]
MTRLKVCIAGATGWAGSALSWGVAATTDLELVSAVSRSAAGGPVGAALGDQTLTAPVFATAEEALDARPCDVFVEYTKPQVAKANVLAALRHGAYVVVGTSGLTDHDYADIDVAARQAGRGVLACGNFALTVVLLLKFAEAAAKHIPHWEIIDYASAGKRDAPSGTARELASRLGAVGEQELEVPIAETVGERAARGATLGGAQVHAVRLPGYRLGAEVVFGLPDQRLTIRHDAGASAEPYVDGALLAIRKVGALTGLHRGLDAVLEL